MAAYQRRTRRPGTLYTFFPILMAFLIIIFFVYPRLSAHYEILGETGSRALSNVALEDGPGPVDSNFDTTTLHSRNALLIRTEDHKILFDLGGREKIYPASMTKIMTALLAIQRIPNLEDPIAVPPEIFPVLAQRHSSLAGFQPGDEASGMDLVYGCLLPSGGEASLTLALEVAGSEENFADLMNEEALQLGMKDTHFTDVCGLHDDDHYSTPRDLAVLLEHALENEIFYEAFTAKSYTTNPTASHPEGLTFYSTLFYKSDGLFPGGSILGGKTGYTGEAGLCLASLAEKNGARYILVTAGAPGTPYTDPYHVLDALNLYGNYLL